ncbi:unnamed protein product [Arctia plantaginis]|uniref:Uncharacterized protein n=1 Tax=Arctia plantaginis TaxID=874455 RepID=A0A8S1B948_ARCPL|nr:unnamed protein product [Arctia plantaginis]CAB3256177.1 unnamed protein product [Arctia plantaginis]
MRLVKVLLVCLLVAFSEGSEDNSVEARGKKKKIALLIYFLDLVVKKIFIVKIIYAFAFWLLLHKAGYFFGWFVSYLKEQKHEYHHHPHHHYEEYGPHGHYRRQNQQPISKYNPYSSPERNVRF